MKTVLDRSIAKRNQQQEGFTLIELIVTVSIVGILSALAVPSFTDSLDHAVSNAKQFVVDAAKDCSITVSTKSMHQLSPADAGSDVTLTAYNCVEKGSVVAEGDNDRWTL